MSMSSGKSKSTATIPKALQDAYVRNIGDARQTASSLWERQFADFAPDYNAGADVARNTIAGGQGLNTVGQGVGVAGQAGQYNPLMVNGGSFLNANMNAYMNPFLQNVAGNTINDMYRARQMQGLDDNNAALRAGAFGGSRHGVAEAETNRNFYDRLGSTLGNLYAGGYDSASQLAQSDLQRALAAQQANQSAGLTANQQSLSAAQLLGQLGSLQQTMGLEGADALMNLGLTQQQLDQARLDAPRDLLLQQQEIRNAATGLYPGIGSNSSGSQSGFSLLS